MVKAQCYEVEEHKQLRLINFSNKSSIDKLINFTIGQIKSRLREIRSSFKIDIAHSESKVAIWHRYEDVQRRKT